MKAFHNTEYPAPVRSVAKALGLLDAVIQADLSGRAVTLGELAEQAGMRPNSAHNLIKTLVSCGYARQRARGQYEMGSKCRQLGRISSIGAAATQPAVLECLRRFAERYGETCVLAALVNGERVILAQVDSSQAVRVSHATARAEPFFAKPTGRLLAAISDEAELQQILTRQEMPGKHWDGIRSEAKLRRALAALREASVCIVEDTQQDLVALAVPVAAESDRTRCVLGAFAPLYRCDAARRDELLKGLRRSAGELEKVLSSAGSGA